MSAAILETMFPGTDKDLIQDVLKRCNGNVQSAVDKLLAINESPPKASHAHRSPPTSPSEPRALRNSPQTPLSGHRSPVIGTGGGHRSPVVGTGGGHRSPVVGMGGGHRSPVVGTGGGHRSLVVGMGGSGVYTGRSQPKKLIILRGLPGSGKTTLAKELVGDNGVICSTDDFFMENGRYLFDPTRLSINHERNQEKARQAMRSGKSPVIIDNTNTVAWEMKPYVTMGLEMRYEIEFKEPNTEWKSNVNALERYNKHGIGRDIIERMLERYQPNMTVKMVLASEKPQPRSPQLPYHHGNRYHGNGSRANHQHGGHYSPRSYGGSYGSGGYGSQSHSGSQHGSRPTRTESRSNSQTVSMTTETQTNTSQYISRSGPHTQTSWPQIHTTWAETHTVRPDTHTDRHQNQSTSAQTRTAWSETHTTGQSQSHVTQNPPRSFHRAGRAHEEEDPFDFSPPSNSSSKGSSDDVKLNELLTALKSSEGETPVVTAANYVISDGCRNMRSLKDDDSSILLATDNNRGLPTAVNDRGLPAPVSNDRGLPTADRGLPTTVNNDRGLPTADRGLPTAVNNDRGLPMAVGNDRGLPMATTSAQYNGGYTYFPLLKIDSSHDGGADTTWPSFVHSSGDVQSHSRASRTETHTGTEPSIEPDVEIVLEETAPPKAIQTGEGVVKPTGGAAKEGGAVGGVTTDLEFLQSCFPNFSPAVLALLFTKANHVLADAVDLVLHLPVPEETISLDDSMSVEDEWMDFEEEDEEESQATGSEMPQLLDMSIEELMVDIEGDEDIDTDQQPDFQEVKTGVLEVNSGAQEVNSGVREVNSGAQEEEISYDLMKELGFNKKQYTRALRNQREFEKKKKDTEPRKDSSSTNDDIEMKAERKGDISIRPEPDVGSRPGDSTGTRPDETGMSPGGDKRSQESEWDDSNLLLRLTPSLAKQLQNTFGEVPQHLLKNGSQDDDLVVLLNESTARGIYQKWIDTLEAKEIEYQLSKGLKPQPKRLQVSSSTVPAAQVPPTRSNRKRRKRNKEKQTPADTAPSLNEKREWPLIVPEVRQTSLLDIMDEQYAEQVGQLQVDEFVIREMKTNAIMRLHVMKLYELFPRLNHSVIHWHYYKAKGDYTVAQSSLDKIAPKKKPLLPTPGTVSRQATTTTASKQDRQANEDPQTEELDLGDYDYHDLRAEAAIHAKLRSEAFQKAAEARGKKEGELAVFYAQKGHMHTEKMKDANRRAAEMTYKMKNKGRPDDTLDLHCLHVSEALQALAEKLATLRKGSHLFVITGRGLHSSKGVAKLKPAVIDYLKRTKWKYREVNAGLLQVIS